MKSPAPTPASSDDEVRAVGRLLSFRPDQLVSYKLPGPGALGESVLAIGAQPKLEGFDSPERLWLEWVTNEQAAKRPAVLYKAGEGGVVIISHESGPEIWIPIIDGVVAAAAAGAVAALIEFVRDRRRQIGRGDGDTWAYQILREYHEDGTLRREQIRLERKDDDN